MSFTEKDWLKDYINNNNTLRKNTTCKIKKDYYKLMNNAVFGKTMENVFNRKNLKIVNTKNKRKIKKYINDPTFKK